MTNSLVLVVGAGASHEVGLPIGSVLRKHIADVLDFKVTDFGQPSGGDAAILAAMRNFAQNPLPRYQRGDLNPYLRAARQIHDGMDLAASIDNFIHEHRNDELIPVVGKLAIVATILAEEGKSKLRVDNSNRNNTINFGFADSTWFASFFRLLTVGFQKEELADRFRKVAVISFNYDRCLEHFLHYALMRNYGMDEGEAAELMRHLRIYHPYGTVADLPWMGTGGMAFGAAPHVSRLPALAGRIRTFTEEVDDNSEQLTGIRRCLRDAEKTAFIGFAFHDLNLKLLYDPDNAEGRHAHPEVFATTLNVSETNLSVIRTRLCNMGHYHLPALKCFNLPAAGLFAEVERRLQF